METKPLQLSVDLTSLSRFDRFFLRNPFWGKARHVYGDLLDQLDDRTEEDLNQWGKYPAEIRELFNTTSPIIIECMLWPETSIFLPDDPLETLLWAHFGDWDTKNAIDSIEELLGIKTSDEFWQNLSGGTYAQLLQKYFDEKSRTIEQ